jgi:hypothetical protein
LNEKEKLFAAFREMERQMRDANFDLDRELHPDSIERSWSQLMMLFQVNCLSQTSCQCCGSMKF